MINYYFIIGTNLGDKQQNLHNAVKLIEERIGRIVSLSAFYETVPWGFTSEHTFLNAALCVRSPLSPFQVLPLTQAIERDLGRTHKSTNGSYSDRLIDIDILLCDNVIINTSTLQIPHPLMHMRSFVLQPLAEIAPDMIHPSLGKSIKELLDTIKSSNIHTGVQITADGLKQAFPSGNTK